MKIFKLSQVQELDKYTIENEPITSIDLMERAASAIFDSIRKEFDKSSKFNIVVGSGNNGGDGFVVARLLHMVGNEVCVHYCEFTPSISEDCKTNLERFQNLDGSKFSIITSAEELRVDSNEVIIDALFGSGLTREVSGVFGDVVKQINNSKNTVLAIDIPSGLFGEDNRTNKGAIVNADITYALEFPSLSLLYPENFKYSKSFQIIPIGLCKEAIDKTKTDYSLLSLDGIKQIFKTRDRVSHKGTYGHALLVAGSYGMAGAAVLAAKACVRSGVGLVSVHVPQKLVGVLQNSIPEAMLDVDVNEFNNSDVEDIYKYSVIGIGPGIGTSDKTHAMLKKIIPICTRPIVIDADGLNILAKDKNLLGNLKPNTIITPHPKEFERLFGEFTSSEDRLEFMQQYSVEKRIIVILKGANTCISLPNGELIFNVIGNPGMATGGSGDVLTGIITALLAQDYSVSDAAKIGVYVHALAGDFAKEVKGETALIASDIIDNLGTVFKMLEEE